MRTRRGFTLIEMAMVMMTVGILCAVAVPRYSAAINRYGADAAAARIVADLSLAQTTARTFSRNQTITFNVSAKTYQMTSVRADDSAANTYVVDLSRSPYQAKFVSVNFANAQQVTFNRYGAPGAAGTIVLQCGDVTRTITLDANSGKASVQ